MTIREVKQIRRMTSIKTALRYSAFLLFCAAVIYAAIVI